MLKMLIFAGRHFFIRKMKIKMAAVRNMCFSKVVKNVVLLHETSEMVFYRQQRSWWYHFSNFEHFLKAVMMMKSLARS